LLKGGVILNSLKDARQKKGITRKELAEKSNIPIRTLESYEQGLRCLNRANIKTVLTLASVLDVEPDDLLN